MGNGKDERFVINMFSQLHPGEPFTYEDSFERRIRYFASCLNKVYKIDGLQSIAIQSVKNPEKIGNFYNSYILWKIYYNILRTFSVKFPKV